MAAGDWDQTSIATCKTVRIVKDLDVILLALCEVDRMLVVPVMMVLMETDSVTPGKS